MNQSNDDFFTSLMHTKGKQYIEHFSTIKMKYKKLAITILGALLLALSYIAGYSGQNVHVDKLHFVAILIIISVIGINLIRYLDVNVSHEQIRMLFKKIMELEEQVSALPKPYLMMSRHLYTKKFDPVLIDFLYYSSINIGIIMFGFAIFAGMIQPHHPQLDVIFSFVLLVFFLVREIVSLLVVYKKRMKFTSNYPFTQGSKK